MVKVNMYTWYWSQRENNPPCHQCLCLQLPQMKTTLLCLLPLISVLPSCFGMNIQCFSSLIYIKLWSLFGKIVEPWEDCLSLCPSSSMGLQTCTTYARFLIGAGNPISSTNACVTGTLLTEPPLQVKPFVLEKDAV